MERITSKNVLEQRMLHNVEVLCTQEQPPACSATCPLHVDMRAITKELSDGNEKAAYTIFSKTIPFPQVVAHCCNAPCEKACKRKEIGGSIHIRSLEQAICEHAQSPRKIPLVLPKKNDTVAIIGASLRGLAAAFDLMYKGISVTIFEKTDRLGGVLNEIETLPHSAIESDFSIFKESKFPVSFRLNEEIEISDGDAITAWREKEGFDAVYLACENAFEKNADKDTLQTGFEMLFAGHRPRTCDPHEHSAIYDIFDGKSASASIQRSFQKVSIMAGREMEGSFETKLFTNIDEYEILSSEITDGNVTLSKELAQKEAARCIQCECLECVKGCAFMRHYKSYPRKYVREVYNNLSISMGTHHANSMINACSLCGQCGAVCPNGLNMADIFLAARQVMVNTDKMPPSAFEFAMLDMKFSNSDSGFLARHQAGYTSSKYLFFPSCQLIASEPELVETVYSDLCGRLDDGVALMLACCGIMAKWAGKEELYNENIEFIKMHWEKLGKPQIISACPSCLNVIRENIDADAIGIWDIYADQMPEYAISGENRQLAIHDACGARHDDKVKEAIRKITSEMGFDLREQAYRTDDKSAEDSIPAGNYTAQSPCCGYGGLTPISNREVANEMAVAAAFRSSNANLTYCVNCRDRFISNGKEAYHILELLFDGKQNARHKAASLSERQENRKYLKTHMLETIWNEKTDMKETIKIKLDPSLEKTLEERLILRSDIAQCIELAESSRERFREAKSGHYIAYNRPGNVTFWVEYSKDEDDASAFYVYNAYSHRMEFEAQFEFRS